MYFVIWPFLHGNSWKSVKLFIRTVISKCDRSYFICRRFFDTNSISKITSRFSGDINIIDDVSELFCFVLIIVFINISISIIISISITEPRFMWQCATVHVCIAASAAHVIIIIRLKWLAVMAKTVMCY